MNDDANPARAIADRFPGSPYARANVRTVIAHYLRARLLAGMAGVLFVILLARHMEVREYARFATIAGISATLGMLSSIGLEKAVTCYVPQGRIQQSGQRLAHFIWRVLGLRVAVLVAATSVLAGAWTLWADAPALPAALVLIVALWIVAANCFQFQALILQCLVQQRSLSLVLIVQWGSRLTLLAVLLYGVHDLSLRNAMVIMLMPELLGNAVLLIALLRHLRQLAALDTFSVPAQSSWPVWRDVRTLMRHNYGYAWLIAAPQANAMIVLVALILSVPQVAAYGFFASIVERLRSYLPLQFMLNLAEPVLVAGYVRDRNFDELSRRSSLLYKMNVVVLVLLLAWSCVVAPVLTRLLTGEKYAAWAMIFPLLLGQIALGSFNTILQVIVNSVGRSEILTRSGSAALALMGLCFLGIMLSGRGTFLVLATPLVFEIANIATTILLLRRAGFPCKWHGLFHAKVASAGLAAALVTSEVVTGIGSGMLQVVAAALISASVFATACALLRIAERGEIAALKVLLRRGPEAAP
jgi:O-antigen/teichoic acid export membrane protein